jgi:hypothetical protein
MSDSGSISTETVPSRNGRFSFTVTRPSAVKVTCSWAMGGLNTYLTKFPGEIVLGPGARRREERILRPRRTMGGRPWGQTRRAERASAVFDAARDRQAAVPDGESHHTGADDLEQIRDGRVRDAGPHSRAASMKGPLLCLRPLIPAFHDIMLLA